MFHTRFRRGGAVVFTAIAILLSGCAFSAETWLTTSTAQQHEVRELRVEGERLIDEGRPLEGLTLIAQALAIIPGFEDARWVWVEEGTGILTDAYAELDALGTPTTMEDAARHVQILSRLVAMNRALNANGPFKLPIVSSNAGTWEGPILRLDEYPSALVNAFEVWLAGGEEAVADGQFEDALTRFDQALVYAQAISGDSSYETRLRERAPAVLTSFAEPRVGSADVETLLDAHFAYKLAARYSDSSDYAEERDELVRQIAEAYYAVGVTKQDAAEIDEAIAAYASAMEWIDEYQDSLERMYTLRIGRIVGPVREALARVRSEHAELEGTVLDFAELVANANDVMETITAVSDAVRDVDDALTATDHALSALHGIPVVGSPATTMRRGVERVHDPVESLVERFDRFEEPVIRPTADTVGEINTYTQALAVAVTGLGELFGRVDARIDEVEVEIAAPRSRSDYERLEHSCELVAETLNSIADGYHATNAAIAAARDPVGAIEAASRYTDALDEGIDRVSPILDRVGSVADEINDALDVGVSVRGNSLSVRDVLEGSFGRVKFLSDLFTSRARRLVDPLLDRLDIDVPTIPGVTEIADFVDDMEARRDAIHDVTATFQEAERHFAEAEVRLAEATED